jgi:hypothetical protein
MIKAIKCQLLDFLTSLLCNTAAILHIDKFNITQYIMLTHRNLTSCVSFDPPIKEPAIRLRPIMIFP